MTQTTNKRLERERAIKWWNTLSLSKKTKLTSTCFEGRDALYLTGKEIQVIYVNQKDLNNNEEPIIKHNDKEFKQFDRELYLNYLNKFKLNDRYDAVALGLLTLQISVEDIHRITDILIFAKNQLITKN